LSGTGRLDPAVAAVRRAVRLGLADIDPGRRVHVACSGGPDSMALAAATAFEGARAGWLVGAVVVDHGLHADSAEVAAAVAGRLRSHHELRGLLDPVEVVRVQVGSSGGPEAAARAARYAALADVAGRDGAVIVLGHTRDDQAETVLLGLARGSGTRSLAGMRVSSGPYRRPLLRITRAQTRQVCSVLQLPVWSDPDNEDARFVRVRVRRTVLPTLEQQLGPGVAEALARTADLATADADALDALAAELGVAAGLGDADATVRLATAVLAPAPRALRRRVLRRAAVAAGSPAGELFAVHVEALDALLVDWHGQGPVDLPGHLSATRRDGWLTFRRHSAG